MTDTKGSFFSDFFSLHPPYNVSPAHVPERYFSSRKDGGKIDTMM